MRPQRNGLDQNRHVAVLVSRKGGLLRLGNHAPAPAAHPPTAPKARCMIRPRGGTHGAGTEWGGCAARCERGKGAARLQNRSRIWIGLCSEVREGEGRGTIER